MKTKRLLISILCVFTIIFLSTCIEVLATTTGFSTEPIPDKDKETFLINIKLSRFQIEPERKPLDCFDVNENKMFAVGYSRHERKTVCVYSKKVDFMYGYEFECSGDFGVELKDNNTLSIYFVRSHVALDIDEKGEIESVSKILDTTDNNSYWNNNVSTSKRKVGDTLYQLKNDMGIFNIFATSYSRLSALNENGEETILYDSGTNYLSFIIKTIIFIFFISAVVTCIIKQHRKTKNNSLC